MPTYEYECKSCGHVFETFQSIKDAPLNECPQCGKELRRLINGGSGIIFKGPGFYITDKGKTSGSSGGKTHQSKAAVAGNSQAAKKSQSGSGAGDVPHTAVPAPSDST